MALATAPVATTLPWRQPALLDQATIDAAIGRFRASNQEPANGGPGDAQPGDAQPGDAQPGDALPGDALPPEAFPGEFPTDQVAPSDPNGPGHQDGGIPAPPGNGRIGPFHTYGLVIGAGSLAAFGIFSHAAAKTGIGGDKLASIVIPAAIAGVVGARLYHVATQWEDYKDNLGEIPKIWDGGGAIYGGVGAGVVVGAAVARSRGIHVSPLRDAAALALPIAQAIGRFGNYANQELYGKPTDLPWGLQVDPAYRPKGMEDVNSFHPTFLYEAGWNVALAGGLYRMSKLWKNRPPGALFAMYLGGYGIGRFMVEGLRVDQSKEFGGLRTNQWTSLGIVGASAGALALMVARKGGHI
jgi:prolipoprotein diacylglyceryl transferase